MKKLMIIILLGLGLSFVGKAQAPGFGDDTEDTNNNAPGFNDDVNDVPVDGGISILLGAGAAYGYRMYRKNRISININHS